MILDASKTASSFSLARGFPRKVDSLPFGVRGDYGMGIGSRRWQRPRLGMPIVNWCGASTPCAAAMPWLAHRTRDTLLWRILSQPGDRFYLCTQNVDDLHERAGSLRVHHMHGTLFQSRCVECNVPFPDQPFYETAANLPLAYECGAPVRPHIVWFGEVPLDMEGIYVELDRATRLLVVGTSGSVYPAAGLVHVANQRGIRTIYVGPEEPLNAGAFEEIVLGSATEELPRLL